MTCSQFDQYGNQLIGHVRARADRPDHLGRGQPQPARPGHPGLLFVRPHRGPDGHGRGREPQRHGRPDQHRGRQRKRPGHRRERSDQRQPVDRELRRPVDRHVLRRDHRRPGSPVQRGGHPRRRLHAPAAQLLSPRLKTSPAPAACWATSPRPPRRSIVLDDQFGEFGNPQSRSSRPTRPRARSSARRSTRPGSPGATTRSA